MKMTKMSFHYLSLKSDPRGSFIKSYNKSVLTGPLATRDQKLSASLVLAPFFVIVTSLVHVKRRGGGQQTVILVDDTNLSLNQEFRVNQAN